MKGNQPLPEPTKAEMEILQVLWQYGPQTVRFVNDMLNEQRKVQYTSTLKLMQLMAEKEMLHRDESAMKHIYKPAIDEAATKAQLLNRFVDNIYNGSASSLVMQLLGNKKTSVEELEAIRRMLEQMNQ
jgi:BlaI family transcriptional regulator, penicillinase repressor